MSWDEVCARLSDHARVGAKLEAPGFGPYILRPPPTPCFKHPGAPRDRPHRCDDCVEAITLAVFDVDHGTCTEQGRLNWLTPADLDICREKLNAAGLAQHWYSSFSHSPGRLSFRLVLPLSQPVQPHNWKGFRKSLIEKYSIPADPKKCSGASHFYFLPATGESTYDFRQVETVKGVPVDAGIQVPKPSPLPIAKATDADICLAEEVTADIDALKGAIVERAYVWKRGPRHRRNGELLQKLVDGVALAEKGERDVMTNTACSLLAYTFSGHSLETYFSLVEPSLHAMQQDGSKLTEEKVRAMLKRAMLAKATSDKSKTAVVDYYKAQTQAALANADRI